MGVLLINALSKENVCIVDEYTVKTVGVLLINTPSKENVCVVDK